MIIPDHLIRGLSSSTRPIVIYRNEYGDVIYGFVMRSDEYVTSVAQQSEARKMAGLPTVDEAGNPL